MLCRITLRLDANDFGFSAHGRASNQGGRGNRERLRLPREKLRSPRKRPRRRYNPTRNRWQKTKMLEAQQTHTPSWRLLYSQLNVSLDTTRRLQTLATAGQSACCGKDTGTCGSAAACTQAPMQATTTRLLRSIAPSKISVQLPCSSESSNRGPRGMTVVGRAATLLQANYFRSLNNTNASSSLRSIPCNAASCAAMNAFSECDGVTDAAGIYTC